MREASAQTSVPLEPAVSRGGTSAPGTAKKATNILPFEQRNDQAIFADFNPYREQPGEDYMSDAQLAHFRLILTTWKRKLMEEVDHTVNELTQESKDVADESDRASQEEQFAIKLRTRNRERKLVQKINDALFRMSNDNFGYCETCGGEIGVARLDARPTAELCIDCKTLEEIRERQGSG